MWKAIKCYSLYLYGHSSLEILDITNQIFNSINQLWKSNFSPF